MDNSSPSSSNRSASGSAHPGSSGLGGSTYSASSGGTGSMGGAGSGGMAQVETRETVERVKDSAHSTVDRLASKAMGWAEKVDERARQVSDIPVRAWDYSRHTVQEHPMQAIVLSMLLGYVIGRFSGGRGLHFGEY